MRMRGVHRLYFPEHCPVRIVNYSTSALLLIIPLFNHVVRIFVTFAFAPRFVGFFLFRECLNECECECEWSLRKQSVLSVHAWRPWLCHRGLHFWPFLTFWGFCSFLSLPLCPSYVSYVSYVLYKNMVFDFLSTLVESVGIIVEWLPSLSE